ncbi:MAG: hypothetical protein R6V46_14520 [Desulfatiglandaceae bacterium]|jgi:hypothetical protein
MEKVTFRIPKIDVTLTLQGDRPCEARLKSRAVRIFNALSYAGAQMGFKRDP